MTPPHGSLTLAELDLLAEHVAARVITHLSAQAPADAGLLDATEAARRLGVARSTVYDNAAQLGAVRLGTGPKARLRFPPAAIAAYAAQRNRTPEQPRTPRPVRPRRTSTTTANGTPLLPIGGNR